MAGNPKRVGRVDGHRYIEGTNGQLIDVSTMSDDIDPGVRWAFNNPEEAEAYCRRLHPWGFFWRDLRDYLRAVW